MSQIFDYMQQRKGVNMDIKKYEKLLTIALDKLEQAEMEIILLKHENNRLQKRIENKGVNK